ncbi:DUF1740-domain-containing protein [Pleomassaria siparia CBS 279.74]|uniref:DUF1740-domain-containing protein n=1 Tax=Pleomassaria siparia CBS 279.74 TaxID=1314801 RepID=A0A6G1KPZ7_9PLEO|nr:DUF1740-domain-containing protein [Pleomassaria siparia CBS 279.74]
MASNIPKFASFRPKPKPEAVVEPPEVDRPSKRSAKSSPRPEKRAKPSKKSAPAAQRETSTRDVYIVDRKGDLSNLTYGALNRYSVPAYRHYGYGCVMGVPTSQRINRDRTTDQEMVLTPAATRRQERILTSKHVGRENHRSLRFVKPIGDTQLRDLDYIALSSSTKRKRDSDSDSDAEGNPGNVDYRSIEGKVDSSEPDDPDTKYESGTELDDAGSATTQKNSVLIRKTRDHPHDLQGWLEFIAHQEAMMAIGRSSFELSTSDKRHLADVRVAIYQEAIQNIGSDQDSQAKLYAGLLAEASLIWDDAKLSTKWVDLLAKFPKSLDLWTRYLDFIETNFVNFKYENCRATFLKSLKVLQIGAAGLLPKTYLYIMLRLTSMIQQAGYQELALAMWQALLEVGLLSPGTDENRGRKSLKEFEFFWDSEVARIGEPGAKGWRNFDADDDFSPVAGPPSLAIRNRSGPAYETFLESELEHMNVLKYPGRTTDEVGEDDPFHLVLYSDIEGILETLPQETPDLMIVEAFLCFCRMPTLPRTELYQQRWWMDPFLCHESPRAGQQASTSFTQIFAKYSDCPINHFQMTTELLFDQSFSDKLGPIDIAFVRRALTLLVANVVDYEIIGEYLLALELKCFPTEVFKTAKQLLKAHPASLRLYNAYALVESRRGNSAKADLVFGAALSMQQSAIPFSIPGSLQLFCSWVWEALRRGERNEALWRLLSSKGEVPKRSGGEEETPDQTVLLRGTSVLTDGKERALLGQDYTSAIICTSLLALLAYLSSGQRPESALQLHKKLSTWFNAHKLSHTPAAELHAQHIAQFLIYHTTHAPVVKPSLIRTTVESLITLFPSNTMFLSLHAANEARFSIDDRVRGIMSNQLLRSDEHSTLASWFFAIYFEQIRGEIAGSTSHSVRALFKKAEAGVGAHSPALWRGHVLFELEQAQKEREKRPAKKPRHDGKKRKDETLLEESFRRVKDTFFEGLTKLPWCKEYMMLGFTHLGDLLGEEDKRKVYNVMMEKELRIYVDLDATEG